VERLFPPQDRGRTCPPEDLAPTLRAAERLSPGLPRLSILQPVGAADGRSPSRTPLFRRARAAPMVREPPVYGRLPPYRVSTKLESGGRGLCGGVVQNRPLAIPRNADPPGLPGMSVRFPVSQEIPALIHLIPGAIDSGLSCSACTRVAIGRRLDQLCDCGTPADGPSFRNSSCVF